MQGGRVQDLVVLSLALPTRQWTIWVTSEGRLDAAMVNLSGPDPNFNRAIKLLDLSNFGDNM